MFSAPTPPAIRRSGGLFGALLALPLVTLAIGAAGALGACGQGGPGEPGAQQESNSAAPRLTDASGIDPVLRARLDAAADAVDAQPNERSVWLDLARLYDASQCWAPAERAYVGALAFEEDATSTFHLGRVRVWLGDLEGAVSAFQRSISHVDWYGPAHWRLGRALVDLGRLDEAGAAFETALALDAESVPAILGLARLALIDGASDRAVELLEPLVERSPREPFANDLLARAYRAQGQTELAERALRRVGRPGEETYGDPWSDEVSALAVGAHVDIARAGSALRAKDVRGALALLEPHREEFSALNLLVHAYLESGRFDDADQLLSDARRLHGDHYRVDLATGRVFAKRGAWAKARAHFEAAVAKNPHYGEGWVEVGDACLRLGDAGAAAEALKKAIAEGQDSVRDWTLYGRALIQNESYDRAIEAMGEALLDYPNSANLWATKASAEVRSGRATEARASLERVERRDPRHETLQALRARLAELEGAE